MPEQDQAKRDKGKPVANDNAVRPDTRPAGERGERGDALTSGGNKIHGDELEGIIPGRPSQPHTDREPK